MLSKISAWGPDRETAIRRLERALAETAVLGPATNLRFLRDVLAHPAFRRGDTHTGFLAEHLGDWHPPADDTAAVLVAAVALSRPAPAAGMGSDPAAPPSPWDTLGAWRLGT
jgi:acetyl/propionyl-CoA carboxylase alpha subunit